MAMTERLCVLPDLFLCICILINVHVEILYGLPFPMHDTILYALFYNFSPFLMPFKPLRFLSQRASRIWKVYIPLGVIYFLHLAFYGVWVAVCQIPVWLQEGRELRYLAKSPTVTLHRSLHGPQFLCFSCVCVCERESKREYLLNK